MRSDRTSQQALRHVVTKHDHVTRILALRNRGERDAGRAFETQILERVDGDIDVAGKQRSVDFGGEEFLALDLAQRQIGDAIAASLDRDQFNAGAWT